MRSRISPWFLGLAGGLALSWSAAAVAPTPPIETYQEISGRNLFGLRPPPTVQAPQPQAQALPKITLTGVTTILGNKLALLKVEPTATRPGEQGKEEAMMLTEGQRQGPVEVLEIDENAGKVRVNNSGTVTTLTFEKDGPKLAAPSAPAVSNAASANAVTPVVVPTQAHRLPTRTYRLPVPTGRSSGTAILQPPTPGTSPVAGVPTASAVATPGTSATATPGTAPTSPVDHLTPEQQQVLSEIQEQVNQENQPQQNQPAAPPGPSSSAGTAPGVTPSPNPAPAYVLPGIRR